MGNEPRWLTTGQVAAMNRQEVEETGEPFPVFRPHLLASAVARPIQAYHYGETDLVSLATKLLFAIAQAHAFQQGNKRTAWSACVVFLELNGHHVTAPDTVAFAQAIIDVIERSSTEAAFVSLPRSYVRPPTS